MSQPIVRILGCGRSHRRDDQAGLFVADGLARCDLPETSVGKTEAPGVDLLDDLAGVKLLVIVDATPACAALPAGQYARIDYRRNPDMLAAKGRDNTHTLSVETSLRLGEQLGLIPDDVWIYALTGSNFGYGQELSGPIDKLIGEVCDRIARDVSGWLERQRCTSSR